VPGFEAALMADGPDKQQKLEEAADALREELEQLGAKVTELTLVQPPTILLGFVWGQVFIGRIRNQADDDKEPATKGFELYQLALEYLHAIWSGKGGPFPDGPLDEAKARELLTLFEEFRTKTFQFCMLSSIALADATEVQSKLDFQAKSTWVSIRGHRHQVLEEEFFQFVLSPHDEELRETYGVGAAEVAAGMQRIADAFRSGHAEAALLLREQHERTLELSEREAIPMKEAINKIKEQDPAFGAQIAGATMDLFMGGICNVSRHSKLPEPLLEDLGYKPGEEARFFEQGPFAGTPLRTLPARIRPLIKLGSDYYATDGQFVRDSAYRAIQRGLIGRKSEYRESWNSKQKKLTEGAVPAILNNQLHGATIYNDVYFQDVSTGNWVETDSVGIVDDVLFIIEAKAGVMAMHSPASDFQRHIRAVQDLVVKAYKQCKRFLEYLASAPEVPIYKLEDGAYQEVARIGLASFRTVLPVGLTVEAFTPFSAMCKELSEVTPILERFPFISMSIDDLFVLKRFLTSTGMFFHYFTVRQQVAGIKEAMMFDEQDHLGAYVSRNRFDQDMTEQLKNADMVSWDGFSDKISDYFAQADWEKHPVPQQTFPAELAEILTSLDASRRKGWLELDAHLRDLSGDSRENFASVVRNMRLTLAQHSVRSFLFDGHLPLQVFVHVSNYSVPSTEVTHRGEVACLIADKPEALAVALGYEGDKLASVTVTKVRSPPVFRADYGALVAEAISKRKNYVELGGAKGRRSTEKLSKRAKRRARHKK
jgi:hypothetical protein